MRRLRRFNLLSCLGLALLGSLLGGLWNPVANWLGSDDVWPNPLSFAPPAMAQTVQVMTQVGWLEVQTLRGDVTIQASAPRAARVGDRLTKTGDTLTTGPRSATLLDIDNRIGTIQVAENSRLQVRQLGTLRNGGWVTTLDLARGQARLRVDKRILPKNSIFEVHSPAGVAGVRGTEFGVMVNSQNRMVVGTEGGLVEASAQGTTVTLKPESGSALFPQEPPLPPLPLDRELKLDLEEVDYRNKHLWVNGQIHPLNTIFANGLELAVDKAGRFEQLIPLPSEGRLALKVANSVGDEQGYLLMGLDRRVE